MGLLGQPTEDGDCSYPAPCLNCAITVCRRICWCCTQTPTSDHFATHVPTNSLAPVGPYRQTPRAGAGPEQAGASPPGPPLSLRAEPKAEERTPHPTSARAGSKLDGVRTAIIEDPAVLRVRELTWKRPLSCRLTSTPVPSVWGG